MSRETEVIYEKDFVIIKLKVPLTILDTRNEIRISHMTAKQYRNLKAPGGSKHEQFELLEALSGLSATEIDCLTIDDLGACLGVVNNFLLQLQGTSLKYSQASLQQYLGLLSESSMQ